MVRSHVEYSVHRRDSPQRTNQAHAWHPQARMESRTMVFSGLTVTVAGCLLKVETDWETKTGRITCQRLPSQKELSDVETEAVMAQANLLHKRAYRTLGAGWVIEGLERERVA